MSQYILFTAPVVAGTQANWALLATLTVQVYNYQTQSLNEPTWKKALVHVIFLLQVAQTRVSSHYIYSVLALSWGDPTIFAKLLWSTIAAPIFTGFTALLVQLFFAWRIYQLKKQNLWAHIVSGLIAILAMLQAVTVFITSAKFARTTRTIAELVKQKELATFWLITNVVCDTLITTTMIFILYQYRQQTLCKRTDTILTKLMFSTLETGAVTTAGALLYLVLFLVSPETNLVEIPTLNLGKLYANVLLFILNKRGSQGSRRSTNRSGNRESLSDSYELRLRAGGLRSPDDSTLQKLHITTNLISDARSDRESKMLHMDNV